MPLYQQGGLPKRGFDAGGGGMNALQSVQAYLNNRRMQEMMRMKQQMLPYEMDTEKAKADYYKNRGQGYPYSAPSSNYRIVTVPDPLGINPPKVFRVPIAPGSEPEEIDLGIQGLFGTETPQPSPGTPKKKTEFEPSGFTKPQLQPGKFIKPEKEKSPYPEYPDAFLEDGKWKVIRNGKKYRIEE